MVVVNVRWLVPAVLATLAGPAGAQFPAPARHQSPAQYQALARDLLRELIETNTTHSSGNTTAAAEKMAARLRAAGFSDADIRVLGPVADRGNLVVRLRGRAGGKQPVLLLAHLA